MSDTIPTITVRRGSVNARLLFAMSDDANAPSSRAQLARAANISPDHAKNNLRHLVKRGVVAHPDRDQYVRLVGEVRA